MNVDIKKFVRGKIYNDTELRVGGVWLMYGRVSIIKLIKEITKICIRGLWIKSRVAYDTLGYLFADALWYWAGTCEEPFLLI